MNKRKIAILLVALMLAGGCSSTSTATAVSKANTEFLVGVLTLPIKIVGAALAAAIGAAVGMGMMP